MGKRAWNIVFRNTSKTTCSLRGWPQIVVRTTAGKTVATTVSKVNYSNLAPVPDTKIVLPAGQSAIVTATSATAPGRCVTRWTLGLTLPGAARQVTVPGPAGSFAPCVGGPLRLSPFYAEQTLTRDIKALSSSAAPSPFAAATGAEPATCATAALRASVTSVADEHDGSIIELRLSNAGQACVLPEGWPTVRLDEAGGASQVAKIFPDTAAVQAGRKLLTTYQHGTTQSTALTLSRAGRSPSRCSPRPPGRRPASGSPRWSSTRPRQPGARAAPPRWPRRSGSAARPGFCRSCRAVPATGPWPSPATRWPPRGPFPADSAQPNGPSSFYSGTDSAAPQACGNGPYTEPSGGCSKGSAGVYGEYIGEVGSFMNWQGCTTAGLAWEQANYNMATDNVVKFSTGLGAAAYWFAAGPGVTRTTTAAPRRPGSGGRSRRNRPFRTWAARSSTSATSSWTSRTTACRRTRTAGTQSGTARAATP